MEQTSTFDSFESQLSPEARGYLKTASGWALFLAILGFIGAAFMLLGAVGLFAAGSAMDSINQPENPVSDMMKGPAMGIITLIFTVLWCLPIYFMFKFATKTRTALSTNNNVELTKAFAGLKSYFMYLGIFAILSVIGYIAFIIFAVANAASMMGTR